MNILPPDQQLFTECKKCVGKKKNCGIKEKITRRYYKPIEKAVRKVLSRNMAFPPREDVEDLRNEAFVRLFDKECRRLKQYDAVKKLSPLGWIIMIANQAAWDFLEKRKGLSQQPVPLEEFNEKPDLKNLGKEEKSLEYRETLRLIEEKLGELTPEQRLVFKFYFYDGKSLPEIAELMHRNINAVYGLKYRAIEKLRKLIKD